MRFGRRKRRPAGWLKRKRGSPAQVGKAFPVYGQPKKSWPHQTAEWKRGLAKLRRWTGQVKRELSPELTEEQMAQAMIEQAEKGDAAAVVWLHNHGYELVEEKPEEVSENGEETQETPEE